MILQRIRGTAGPALLLVVACISSVKRVSAQTPTTTRMPATLTLEEAVRLARTNNPQFMQSFNDVEVAEANVRSTLGSILPGVSAGMGINGGRSHVETYPDPVTQKPEQLPNASTSTGSSVGQSVNLSMTLFDGGRGFRTLAAQKASAEAAEAAVTMGRNELDSRVRQAFFLALRAEQSIALNERLLASAQERLIQTEALFRIAVARQSDLLGAKEEIATQQLSVERAKADATKARLALALAIGIASDGSFALAGNLPTVYDPARLNADSLVQIALRSNPTVLRQDLMVTVAEKQAQAAIGSRWPSISTSFSYSRSVSVPELGAFRDAYKYLNPQNSSLGFGFNLSLPQAFARYGASAPLTAARAAAYDARLQLAQTRLQLESDVRSAYIDFVNAYHSLELAELKASLSEERLGLSQDQYRRNTISFSELQQRIDGAATAQREALNARFTWITALIALELKVGSPVVQ
ncbi:MAG: TolC family protein [Longimicrobiales bacterium]